MIFAYYPEIGIAIDRRLSEKRIGSASILASSVTYVQFAKWRCCASGNGQPRWNEVERTEMDVGIGGKQTGALIRAVASRYHDHRSATLCDNDNKLHASLASSRRSRKAEASRRLPSQPITLPTVYRVC